MLDGKQLGYISGKMSKITTRVDATKEKIALLQEMQGMLHTLKQFAARIDDKINTMIKADLESMQAEKEALEEMENTIKSNGQKNRTTTRVR